MKLAGWKRAVLAGLLTLSVTGGTVAPLVAGHASAEVRCHRGPDGTKLCWHV